MYQTPQYPSILNELNLESRLYASKATGRTKKLKEKKNIARENKLS